MAKKTTAFFCQSCGTQTSKWLGKCPGCGEWNTLVEEAIQPETAPSDTGAAAFRASLQEPEPGKRGGAARQSGPVPLERPAGEIAGSIFSRWSTGIQEFDRVLGGGLVKDGFVLLGGDPGIGKSTLLLQMLKGLVEQPGQTIKLLYASGEESIDQIRDRARRLGVVGKGSIFLTAETELEKVVQQVRELKPQVLIVDSLQTFSTTHLESAPGSVGQLREVAMRLMMLAKQTGVAICLVGHVTKEGSIAGPKVVEHMVDTVLYFEGDPQLHYRLLRVVKNRFGSTRELGVFEMTSDGLEQVLNPSELFLSDRNHQSAGAAITCALEGSRPVLLELQALVSPTRMASPRRTSVGLDQGRVSLLAAILEKHLRIKLSEFDLFFNVAGGFRLTEPSADLAAAASIWSSFEEFALPNDWIFLGELGLAGEVRRVGQLDVRLEEAKKLGFKTALVPALSLNKEIRVDGIQLKGIGRIHELPDIVSARR